MSSTSEVGTNTVYWLLSLLSRQCFSVVGKLLGLAEHASVATGTTGRELEEKKKHRKSTMSSWERSRFVRGDEGWEGSQLIQAEESSQKKLRQN